MIDLDALEKAYADCTKDDWYMILGELYVPADKYKGYKNLENDQQFSKVWHNAAPAILAILREADAMEAQIAKAEKVVLSARLLLKANSHKSRVDAQHNLWKALSLYETTPKEDK